ncbi:sensor histidine kinase [Gracilibacillus kekensis]|uniref:Histidine kinase-, DNA gyrase B-, and HSP90-like ATPase n=1 Tax=Gracilibacillus kekensis TaxID=1027249 RepID=A0A1M7IS58_9BACI|nr:sensor histidine kinase [Gracilibacillus kekensis]SHM43197.1 Histidine kinase-, DNA gyrase B-, and HSP90-like ATPase [Gracilibacillus kekensis]
MNKIQHRIVALSLGIIVVMASFWAVISYLNHHSMKYYQVTLERYLLLNEISTQSQAVLMVLNDYKLKPSTTRLEKLNTEQEVLMILNQQSLQLKNEHNQYLIDNYRGIIDSQLNTMEMMERAVQSNQHQLAQTFYDESVDISQYVNETTLSLLKMEISDHEQIYERMIHLGESITKLGVTTLGTVFVFLLILSYLFSKGITKSIESLIKGAKEIAKGNFDRPINVKANDEMLFLADTFNQMRQSIKELIQEIQSKAKLEKEVKEYELLLKDSELKLLQSQMNPHFLFNTLNALSKKAYVEGAKETSNLMVTVANLLRYNLRNFDLPVTLQEELDIIQEYIEILQARFPNRVKFELSIQTDQLDILLPSLSIQPIVENAFVHSIDPSEFGGTISINISEQPSYIMVEIMDDGKGIESEKIQSLMQFDQSRKSHGIYSVVKRLSIFFGEDDVVAITSKPNIGTCVALKLYKARLPSVRGVQPLTEG